MRRVCARSLLLAGSALTISCAIALPAHAGGFAIREQSAYGQGASFAGIAAGGDLSAMFWNPATMTQFDGIQTAVSGTAIFPYAANTPAAFSPSNPLAGLGGTGNTGDSALVPAGYFSYQINPALWVGMSFNAPFGLSVHFPNLWAGRDYGAGDSHLRTYNATPSLAYQINDWISIGLGVQIQYADAGLSIGPTLAGPVFLNANISGNGWGYGLTAGATLTPTPTTTIGIGYRSAINQKIDGTETIPGLLPTTSVSTTLKLPDMVSLGIRQRLDPQWTLLGTVEWTNWSRIGTSTLTPTGAMLPFQFDDGWLFSLGAEYQATDRLAVRGGVGYEKSPITDQVRMPILPDNDRIWLSAGMSWKIGRGFSADVAYSHLFVRNTSIDITAASGNPWFDGVGYQGTVSSHVDIVSLEFKYRWDEPAAPVRTVLPTK